jgi:hypothetical protein
VKINAERPLMPDWLSAMSQNQPGTIEIKGSKPAALRKAKRLALLDSVAVTVLQFSDRSLRYAYGHTDGRKSGGRLRQFGQK